MKRTPLCDLLGIELPIIQAPIGASTCPALAAAVSNAGRLGMLQLSTPSIEKIPALLSETRGLTQKSFGVNFIITRDVQDKLNPCLDRGVKNRLALLGRAGKIHRSIASRWCDRKLHGGKRRASA